MNSISDSNTPWELKDKRTKWGSTDKIIRKIILDLYTSSKSWEIWLSLLEKTFTLNDISFNTQITNSLEIRQEPGVNINLNGITESYMMQAFHNIIDPENPINWSLDSNTIHQMGNQFKTWYAVKDIIEKYKLAPETINKRLVPFFNVKVINKWKSHPRFLFLKPEVYMALSYYLVIKKKFKNNWDYYRKISELFDK